MATTWTPERVEILTKLWAEGLSGRSIAARLGGVSRNGVIGKAFRMGLASRAPSRSATTRRQHRLYPKKPKRAARPMMEKPPKFKPVPYVVAEKPHIANPIPFDTLPDDGCRFPVSDGPPHFFCDRKKAVGVPYCEAHAAICFNPEPLRTLRPPFEGGGLGLRFQNKRILEHTE